MPTSPTSSHVSAPCRLEWRPSRWLVIALAMLGVLATVALLTCGMPAGGSIPAAVLVAGEAARVARREWRRPPCWLVITASGQATLDGRPIHEWDVQWRGPMAFLRFRERSGRRGHLSWWPDTLSPAARRELRLAVPVQGDARSPSSMAS